MAGSVSLVIDIQSYWHPGSGRGGGEDADAIPVLDGNGLPYLPGRHLKGLLRAAANRWESWGGLSAGTATLLFGSRPDRGQSRHETRPGCLRIGNGALPPELQQRLGKRETGDSILRSGFFARVSATAIDHTSGTALEKSLRTFVVLIPLKLVAVIDWDPTAALLHADDNERARLKVLESKWPEELGTCLPLVRAVGAHRSRGLGRAVVTLQ